MKKDVFGIQVEYQYQPKLDPDFLPFAPFIESYLKTAKLPFAIGLERENQQIQVFETFIHGS